MLFDSKELSNDELRMNPDAQFFPYQMKLQSVTDFSLTLEEKNLVRELRTWSNKEFNTKFVYPDSMFDVCAIVPKQVRACDLHCKIVEIRHENELFNEICLNDETG